MNSRMSQKYSGDRPRERLKNKGAASLSNSELMQAIIGNGNAQADVVAISKHALGAISRHGVDVNYAALSQISGLGPAKICAILASFELVKRYLLTADQPTINSPEDAVAQLQDMRSKSQEHLMLLTLDGANRLINKRTITIGTLTASLVHPREIFAPAITDRAASVILAHNHPSGDPTPSNADRETTRRIQEVAHIVGIPIADHLILTKNSYNSII